MALDAPSQRNRYLFVQPQQVNNSLSVIQAVQSSALNMGKLSSLIGEFVFIGEIIIQYNSVGNWRLTSVSKITGSKVQQTSVSGGLTSVTTDSTLTGGGTAADPLKFAGIIQLEDTASSGTIAILPNTVKVLTTTLTNANTVVITPTAPTTFANQQEATVVVTVGATAPTLTFTPPTLVTFVWMDKAAPSALTINKTYTIVFFWINATTCQVYHAIKA